MKKIKSEGKVSPDTSLKPRGPLGCLSQAAIGRGRGARAGILEEPHARLGAVTVRLAGRMVYS